MQIEIYADILFFVNFFMVFFIFNIVKKFIRKKVKLSKIFLGAFLASLMYIITIANVSFNPIYNFIFVLLNFSLSIFIAFKPINLKEFLKLVLLVSLVSFCFGGFIIAVFYFTNFGNVLSNFLSFSIKNISFKLILVFSAISYIFIKFILNWYKRIFFKKQSFYSIILHKNGEKVILTALLDTGNSLYEPISRKPVTVVQYDAIKSLLTDDLKQIYEDNLENDISKLLEEGLENDIRFIPFKTISHENNIMIGIKIDLMEIHTKENILIENAIIAITKLNISNEGAYLAILNPEILK